MKYLTFSKAVAVISRGLNLIKFWTSDILDDFPSKSRLVDFSLFKTRSVSLDDRIENFHEYNVVIG